MKLSQLLKALAVTAILVGSSSAFAVGPRIVTVTTTNNLSPAAGEVSLLQALSSLQDGDEIRFNIAGAGPHVIATPLDGYPVITKNNVTIDGYSQPGSSPNTNPILAANNAKIDIVLDSRNGNSRLLDFAPTGPTDQTGYGDTESAVVGILQATNVTIRGVSILTVPLTGSDGSIAIYGVSFAKAASGQVNGCWIGVAPDGTTIAGPASGITGFRYRVRDENNQVLEDILINGVVVGVSAGSTSPRSEFNVIVGVPAIPIIIEGNGTRISGNFLNVMPDGLHDFNPPLVNSTLFSGTFEGNIEIGRGGNNTLIGTDGDSVNDADERNVFSGAVPSSQGGYDHNIEFYGQNPGTNIVVAGNYIGVGVDGTTLFTNGVPALNAGGGSPQYRFGSNLDGVSDAVEGNVVYNNWPPDLFPASGFSGSEGFFDELSVGGIVSARGNALVNNFPFPISPAKNAGADLTNYYAKALVDATNGIAPILSTNTSISRIVGTVPLADTNNWPTTIIDLYAADQVGLTNGQAIGIAELPNGFVQGAAYVGSFTDNGPNDRDKKLGSFDFDISTLDTKGSLVTVTANYVNTNKSIVLTSPFSDPVEVTFIPGSIESVGLRRVTPDTVLLNPGADSLGNWEPYASVLGDSTFLIEGNTFAEGSTDNQRFVVYLQPAAGGQGKLGEAFFADNGQPYRDQVNASRQNGNPGRVAGDKRPGAVNFIAGGEASPHVYSPFQSDNRWNLGFDRLADGRYGTIQIYKLDPATLTQTPLSKALDSANGRLTTGDPQGNNQITRFGGELAGLDNANFLSVVEDRSKVRNPDGDAVVATIFAPDGSVVKESFVVANGDIWSNAAAYQGGFAVRVNGIIYFYDNAGNLKGQVDQSTSGESFDAGRGDGTRIAAHINSPYVYLIGKVTTANLVRVAVWDSRDQSFQAKTDVSEGAFTGGFDRANMAVDALNRIATAWVSQPAGYEQQQVAARVLAFDPATKSFTSLTKSFFPFVNAAQTGGIHTFQMTVAMTTRQVMISAKGEINLENNPSAGVDSPKEVNFFTIFTHPDPKDDPTTPVGGQPPPSGDLGRLSFTVSARNLNFSWTGGAGIRLQKATSLNPANWADVAGSDGASSATEVIGAGSAFYRLFKP